MERTAAIYCRVSTEDQEQEGTSLQSQLEACLRIAKEKGYEVQERHIIQEVYSGLTLDRPDLTRLRDWLYGGDINAVIVYDSDRFSRDGYDFVTLIRDCQKVNVELLCITEPIEHGPIGELLSYVRGWASRREAEKIKERTIRGKKRHAEKGDIPSGFGRYSYWGLRYNKEQKLFDHIPGVIHIPKEILTRYVAGESSSVITVDLQRRGIMSATGGKIHRSAINRVLSHASVYAGRLEWDGYPIPGKVKPIITEEEVNIVAERLKKNKELSYGFGKRKPLTGRVSCGLCGRRYSLDASKGCRCNGSDIRNPVRCPAPKIGLRKLTDWVYEAIFTVMMDDEALISRTAEVREQWERETAGIEEKLREKEAQLATFDKRRRHLSWQHERGGLTDDEYLDRLNTNDREKAEFTEQLRQLRKFTPLEEPPKPEDIREALLTVSSVWDKLVCQLAKAVPLVTTALAKGQEQEKQLAKLVEWLDVKAVVYPGDNDEQLKLGIFVNIPIQKQEIGDGVMVSPSSLYYAHRQQLPLRLA